MKLSFSKTRFHRSLVATAVVASCSFSALSHAAMAQGIQVELSLPQSSFSASHDVPVQVTFVNTSNKAQPLLKWYTPEGGVKEDLFDITVNGVDAPYTGMHIKRAAPTKADYMLLQPGQRVQFSVELTSLYDLPVSGNYQIQYHVKSLALFGQPAKLSATELASLQQTAVAQPIAELNSAAVFAQIDVEPSLRSETIQSLATPLAGSVSYAANCSSSRRTSIATALGSAKTYASNSVSYLNNYPVATRANSVRYKTWFGSYTSTRWSKVTTNFSKISSALQNQALQFDCGCTDSYFAYVYPNQPYKVYLCNAFWSAANTGTDSKAGTIVHELSHFTVVAGTDDIAYGQAGAKSLALSNPTQAVINADSHEYFAENTPAQN